MGELYRNLSQSDRIEIGVSAEPTVKYCMAGGDCCEDVFNVTVINNLQLGNCFTFNPKGEMGKVMSSPGSGLEMIVYLARESMPWVPDNDRVIMLHVHFNIDLKSHIQYNLLNFM